MKILILGPTHISFVKNLLQLDDQKNMPQGYYGAPFLGTIIEELLKRGHDVISVTTSECINNDYSVKCFTKGKFQWVVIPERKRSFRMNGNKLGRMVDFFALERKMMVDAISLLKPDIVHAHWSYEFASSAIESKVPYVITVHDNHWRVLQYIPNLYRLFRALMAEKNLSCLESVTTVSPYMATFLRKKIKKVNVVPNPIKIRYNKNFIEDLIYKRSIDISSPQIIMVNNGWDKRKNGQFGLCVLKSLRRRYPKIKLHLVGDGSEFGGPAYNDAIKMGVDSFITFHGRIANDNLIKLLESTHIMLHTSKEESFGVVLGEAASMGVPAFGYHKAGAVPWVIDNESLLYDAWNQDLVSQKIVDLISDKIGYQIKCLKVYDKVVNSFSVEKVVSAFEECYCNELQYFNYNMK